MFLKEITLINFKCHDKLFVSFASSDTKQPIRRTTFMLGENGTGKSALLKAIALITAGSDGLSDILGKPNHWIKNGKPYCEILATIVTAKGDERELKLTIKKNSSIREIISNNYDTLAQIDNAIAKADRNYFVVGYGASRRLNRGEETFSQKGFSYSSARSSNIQTLFNPDASLVSLSNWAIELDYAKNAGGVTTVKNALNQFLVENVKFKKIDRPNKALVFSTPDGDVPLEQLSDGYQNVTAWVGDLMYNITNTFKDHKNPMDARGLLLIDEIDLHLHPKWQRLLHKFLKEQLPNFQVIATTHSPLTAQQAGEGELFALRREKTKVELVAFKGDPSSMLIHQILMAPVFGLGTDESVAIEEAKETVKTLSTKKRKTKAETSELKRSKEKLQANPVNVRRNSLLKQSDLDLLQRINTALTKK